MDLASSDSPSQGKDGIAQIREPSIIQYIPASKRDAILSLHCTTIDVVAHEKLPNGGNHWALYLHTSDPDMPTVQLDVSPSYSIPSVMLTGGSKAFMILSACGRHQDNEHTVTKRVALTVRKTPPITVGEIVETLADKHGRHRYEFDDQGRGCRYWVWDQIALLAREGLVIDREEVVDEARNMIQLAFPGGEPLAMTVGRYY